MKTAEVAKYIVSWMKDYLEKSGQKGFVVGISGGVDSAVVSILAARTGYPVLCLDLPIHQASAQLTRAEEHQEKLMKEFSHVSSKRIDLTPIYDEFISGVNATSVENFELAAANSRARLRMTTLYHFAGLHNYLVAGTGNKIEDFGVGFFTKYGDGGVDISPIADLTKTEVYGLAEELDVIPSIREAAPTDGLFGDSRTDEQQIGATYPELEWAMSEYEKGASSENFEGRQKEVMKIYIDRHLANLHKMVAIPVCKLPPNLHQ